MADWKRWRAWLRAIHRDVGYLAVGFTIIYAISGIAMNHVDDWNYNYNAKERTVQIAMLAEKAGIKSDVKHVILESAHGFTANAALADATKDNCLITYRLNGKPFQLQHGAPVRGLFPDLYFWKSAKWITGVRFVKDDRPGYWEVRGYHNHADPWKEERYG